jgi:hypothetical protein
MQLLYTNELPTAEFAINNILNKSLKITPFFANYGYYSRFGFEFITFRNCPAAKNAEELVLKMKLVHKYLKFKICIAQARYEKYANRKRKPAFRFHTSQKVWLNSKNIKIARPQKKLDWKNLEFWPIIKVISSYAYRLELPPFIKIHPVFHVNLLRPAFIDSLLG